MALALLGCDKPVSRSDATDIAEDMADAHTSRLAARVEELEGKVEELEQKLERLDTREEELTDATASDLRTVNARVSNFIDAYDKHTH